VLALEVDAGRHGLTSKRRCTRAPSGSCLGARVKLEGVRRKFSHDSKRELKSVTGSFDLRSINGLGMKLNATQRRQVHMYRCEPIQQYRQLAIRPATAALFFARGVHS
ncbi:MAG TPA: hypothetical protein VF014_03105, partial [Casimicrobiaceae bacterium]|nr:hypothetical protein [Casimicrobiaceae bacterium]